MQWKCECFGGFFTRRRATENAIAKVVSLLVLLAYKPHQKGSSCGLVSYFFPKSISSTSLAPQWCFDVSEALLIDWF